MLFLLSGCQSVSVSKFLTEIENYFLYQNLLAVIPRSSLARMIWNTYIKSPYIVFGMELKGIVVSLLYCTEPF